MTTGGVRGLNGLTEDNKLVTKKKTTMAGRPTSDQQTRKNSVRLPMDAALLRKRGKIIVERLSIIKSNSKPGLVWGLLAYGKHLYKNWEMVGYKCLRLGHTFESS